ncbi:hypothetical protein OG21DRAFT_210559 [Imleria badia]|nr:hypothetical protein OG21DRAFT_210559 [Imleria badia]
MVHAYPPEHSRIATRHPIAFSLFSPIVIIIFSLLALHFLLGSLREKQRNMKQLRSPSGSCTKFILFWHTLWWSCGSERYAPRGECWMARYRLWGSVVNKTKSVCQRYKIPPLCPRTSSFSSQLTSKQLVLSSSQQYHADPAPASAVTASTNNQ